MPLEKSAPLFCHVSNLVLRWSQSGLFGTASWGAPAWSPELPPGKGDDCTPGAKVEHASVLGSSLADRSPPHTTTFYPCDSQRCSALRLGQRAST